MMLRTAQQRKELCRECGVAKVADLLGDSCTLLLIRDLLEAPQRFTDLQKSLSGISTRTLTNKLKRLEQEGLLKHEASGYHLTDKGEALGDIVEAMRAYGRKYL